MGKRFSRYVMAIVKFFGNSLSFWAMIPLRSRLATGLLEILTLSLSSLSVFLYFTCQGDGDDEKLNET